MRPTTTRSSKNEFTEVEMAFMNPLARSGMFGVAGLAATDKKKKVDIRRPLEERAGRPSLINDRQRQLY